MPRITTTGTRNADAIENALTAEKRAIPGGLNAAASIIQPYIELKVSTPWPPPSDPGTPAHMRTGKYRRGWNVKARGYTLTIRNPVKYALYLEGGTRYMTRRPAITGNTGPGTVRRLTRAAGRTAADTARRLTLPRNGAR